MKKSYKIILFSLLLLVIGGGIGYAIGFEYEQGVFDKKFTAIHPLRDTTSGYSFIDPLLLYIIPSADQEWGLGGMKNQITNMIANEKGNGLTDPSVFFQDLNQGRWMGINQNDQYNPASMLKVVIMVSYFKKAEDNPALLNQELVYTSEFQKLIDQDPNNQTSQLVVGKEYSVDDLIKKMIIDSDNGAAYLLLNNINQSSLDSLYEALDIPDPDDTTGDFTISPRYYSFFFRILYSATYLDDEYSEKALQILSDATFKDGIVSGVPAGVAVSHKYGEYVADGNTSIELHDCGIVYYPKSPYLLCVMTKGNNLDELKKVIQNISSTVYKNYSGS